MQRKVLRTLKAAVAFSMVFSLSVPAWAASDKQQVQQNLDALESQKDALESRLSALQANKADTESYIAQLDQELNSVYAQVSSLTQQLEQTQEELTSTQEQLETAKAKEDEQYEALKLRIRAMYAAGDTSMLSVFLQASDISSILNATEYISRLSDYDANLLESLNNTRQEIETLEASFRSRRQNLRISRPRKRASRQNSKWSWRQNRQSLARSTVISEPLMIVLPIPRKRSKKIIRSLRLLNTRKSWIVRKL